MKKTLTILLSIIILFTCAVSAAAYAENEVIDPALAVRMAQYPNENINVWIFLKNCFNQSEVESFVMEQNDINELNSGNADEFLKLYRAEVSKRVTAYIDKFLEDNSDLIGEVLFKGDSTETIIACLSAENIEKLAQNENVWEINWYFGGKEDVDIEFELLDSDTATIQGMIYEHVGAMWFDNLIHIGKLGDYDLYYNDPQRPLVMWSREFTFGRYKFIECAGQTGNYIPADLGVFVIVNGEVYDLREAFDCEKIDFDLLVKTLRDYQEKNEGFSYTFGIEDISEPAATEPSTDPGQPATEPSTNPGQPATEPSTNPGQPTTEPATTICPKRPDSATEKQKKENPIKVTAKTKTVRFKKLKKSRLTVSVLTVKNARGKVSFKKISGSKALSLTKKGKITIKKGTKRGIYKLKIRITAKGNSKYAEKSVVKNVKIIIK
ncbi:MAG: hypothetical protein IIU14_04620 [Ruminococcus sp.]|nr:hypothetical protein [Ruminococcus sp.]